MTKNKTNNWLFKTIAILAIFIIPFVANLYFRYEEKNTFYEYQKQDYEFCIERAKEDSRAEYWCREIRDSSEQAFQSAVYASEIFVITLPLQIILTIVFLRLQDLKEKVENIEQIND